MNPLKGNKLLKNPLEGKNLLGYLDYIKTIVKNMAYSTDEEYLESLMHSQMSEIITAEIAFLKDYHNYHKGKAHLYISGNGFPSVNTLIPDLESMCKISEEKKLFQGIAKKFKKGIGHEWDYSNEGKYMSVDEDDWKEELETRKGQKLKLSSEIGFSVDETSDGKFELSLREEIYLQGYDQYSKEFPIMIREGKIKCQLIWGQILQSFEKNFYVPNTEFELEGKIAEPSKKSFNGLSLFYKFKRFDYKIRAPVFLKWKGESIDYSKFLAAGTGTRVEITKNILETLYSTLKKEVIMKGVGEENLEKVLAFSNIPFKNAPKTTLSYYKLRDIEKKNKTRFDLIYNSGGRKVGEIKYVLPHNNKKYSDEDDVEFILGGVKLIICGSSISNESQNEDLKEGLKRAKKGKLEWKELKPKDDSDIDD